ASRAAAPPLPILCTATIGRVPIDPTLAVALLSLSPSTDGRQHGAAMPSGATGSRRDGDGVVARQRIHAWPRWSCPSAGPFNSSDPDLGSRGEEGGDRNGSPMDPVLQVDPAALPEVHGHGRRRRRSCSGRCTPACLPLHLGGEERVPGRRASGGSERSAAARRRRRCAGTRRQGWPTTLPRRMWAQQWRRHIAAGAP
ncbi:unnamed protein product, partial [Urochloa humidicola]